MCTIATCTSVFLISSYGTPLAQRASYLAQNSSHFEPDGAVNYDHIVTNNIKSLLIGSRCILNGTHTNNCCSNLAHTSKHIKNCDVHIIHQSTVTLLIYNTIYIECNIPAIVANISAVYYKMV